MIFQSAHRGEELIGAQITWSPDGRSIVAGRDPRVETSVPAGLSGSLSTGETLVRLPDRSLPRSILILRFPQTAAGSRTCRAVRSGRPCRGCCRTTARCALWTWMARHPASAPRALTTQPVDPSGLAWNRDGTSIIFVGGGPDRSLWRVGTDRVTARADRDRR